MTKYFSIYIHVWKELTFSEGASKETEENSDARIPNITFIILADEQ